MKLNPHNAHLSLDELGDMVRSEGKSFSSMVMHCASSLQGTNRYWFKQRSNLISMMDTLRMLTISLPTVLPIVNGLTWLASSAPTMQTAHLLAVLQWQRIWPLLTGTSTHVSGNSLMSCTLDVLC